MARPRINKPTKLGFNLNGFNELELNENQRNIDYQNLIKKLNVFMGKLHEAIEKNSASPNLTMLQEIFVKLSFEASNNFIIRLAKLCLSKNNEKVDKDFQDLLMDFKEWIDRAPRERRCQINFLILLTHLLPRKSQFATSGISYEEFESEEFPFSGLKSLKAEQIQSLKEQCSELQLFLEFLSSMKSRLFQPAGEKIQKLTLALRNSC